ncbi:MAG: type II secretion system protein [Bacilli bacterium]|nr:type II secretion system protein [Bacilli bacterium]
MRNEKGFTLIELLAVIVILGILMFVAIPMVTRYINNSRRDTFVDNAKMALNQAKTEKASCDVDDTDSECANWTTASGCPSGSSGKQVSLDDLQFEKKLKSPFTNSDMMGHVMYCTDSQGATDWYFQGTGTKNNATDGKGFPNDTIEDQLTRANVTA